jgi:DNA mismatch repair protein MSH5
MKQVGLIVYLAHVGCWVPAAAGARIPLTNKLFTRIQTVESVSLGLSSFLCDVNQVGDTRFFF